MTEKLLGFHETSPITANAGSSATQTYVCIWRIEIWSDAIPML